ncbi:MAG: DUF58 domain-containing protein, partial [Gemmatimonadaceae bacterium]|nr:DUF58 domain-containing protein [Gemmatimonadaceae bacterium]
MPPAGSYGSLLDALRGVTWPARRTIRGPAAGTHRSRQRGISPEFTEYRPYRQGDDPRRLDWKLLARTDRAFLRITNDRATLGTILVLDASASMSFPLATQGKWAQACRLAIGLAAVAHGAGDPVGMLVAGAEGIAQLQPRTRRGVIGEAARLLESIAPAGGSSLVPALAHVRPTQRIVLISDFLADDDELLREARERITAGADVLAIHIVAREELEPSRAAIIAQDPERSELKRSLVDETREGYREAFAAWRAELAR